MIVVLNLPNTLDGRRARLFTHKCSEILSFQLSAISIACKIIIVIINYILFSIVFIKIMSLIHS